MMTPDVSYSHNRLERECFHLSNDTRRHVQLEIVAAIKSSLLLFFLNSAHDVMKQRQLNFMEAADVLLVR